MIDINQIRADFPIFKNNKDLVYLDSAASSLKVNQAIDAVGDYYCNLGANVHRGTYALSHESTVRYENARDHVAKLINANRNEVVFTRGTTTSLNMVASMYRELLKPGDEVITSELEHHSSVLPWMMATKRAKATLRYVPLTDEGRITIEGFQQVLTDQTKVVALTLVSNVFGFVSPMKEIIRLAHEKGAIVVVDAAQAVPHMTVDVKDLDCDYLAFSGHKMFGPSGIGVLYGKIALLNTLEPCEYGGEMVDDVTKDHIILNEAPIRLEAGTPIIAGAIGLGAAADYMMSIGLKNIHAYTFGLKQYAYDQLSKVEGVTIYNESAETGILTFNVDGVHPHDVATYLDQYHIDVRAGKHCAYLIHQRLGLQSTVRASFQIYNNEEDCDKFVKAIIETKNFFHAF